MHSAEDFNAYFVNIASHIIESIPSCDLSPLEYLRGLNVSDEVSLSYFEEITPQEVIEIVDSLKNSSSRDIFGLSNTLIKFILEPILEPIVYLTNSCFQMGHFPDIFKCSRVTPVYKKGPRGDISNYQPISIVPILSKIIESAMKRRILGYFETNKLFINSQYGFRPGRSTTMAMVDVIATLTSALEGGCFASVTLCDLSKAFDCVAHDILLQKLQHYRVVGKALELIKSYLSNRTQFVQVSRQKSSVSAIQHGVPQGSILGPILFIIYANDLPYSLPNVRTCQFADDTTLINISGDVASLNMLTERSEQIAEGWFSSNKLKLNESKTQHLTVTLRLNVNPTESVKLLGFHLDSKLTWAVHLENLSTRLARNLYLLRQLGQNVSPDVVRAAYFAFFHTHLQYGILIWGHCGNQLPIFRMQKAAVRAISGVNCRTTCRPFFISQKILTLCSIYILECLTYVKVNIQQFNSHSDTHTHLTRKRHDIDQAYVRLTKSMNGVNFYGPKFFNKLPGNVRDLDVKAFKSHLKKFLIGRGYYEISEFLNDDLSDLL